MRNSARVLMCLGFAFLSTLCSAAGAFGQTMTVTATAGAPSPDPACINQQIAVPLSATVSNPPSPPYPYSLNGPTWAWKVVSVSVSQDGSTWTAGSTSGVWIVQPDPSSSAATLYGSFGQSGYYQVTVQATATYTDAPGTDVWSASGTTNVTMTAVSVDRIQFLLPGASGFRDMPAEGLYVAVGTTVTFKAIPSPANAPWPSGYPVWGGSCGAAGTGGTTSVTLGVPSQSMSDYQTITATCGNTVTGSIVRYPPDQSSLTLDDQTDPTKINAYVTYTLWARDANLDGLPDSLGGTVILQGLDMTDPAAGNLIDVTSWAYSNGVPASQQYPLVTGIDAGSGGTTQEENPSTSPSSRLPLRATPAAVAARSPGDDRRLFQPGAAVIFADILKQEGGALAKELLKELLAQIKPGAAQINPPNPSNNKVVFSDGVTQLQISLSTRAQGNTGIEPNGLAFLLKDPTASITVTGSPANVTVAGQKFPIRLIGLIWNHNPKFCAAKGWKVGVLEFDLGVQESGLVKNLGKTVGKTRAAGLYTNDVVRPAMGMNPAVMTFKVTKGFDKDGNVTFEFNAAQDDQMEADQSIVWPS